MGWGGASVKTLARPSDLAKAEFDHFDLESLIWHKHNTKGIKLSRSLYEYAFRSVPIHPRVAAMVRAQRQRWPEAGGRRAARRPCPRRKPSRAWARWAAGPGMAGLVSF